MQCAAAARALWRRGRETLQLRRGVSIGELYQRDISDVSQKSTTLAALNLIDLRGDLVRSQGACASPRVSYSRVEQPT